MSNDYKYLFKIVLVGNAGVGKTCLVSQFTQGNVSLLNNTQQGATIGVDFTIKTVLTDNNTNVKLQLWDTAGQERFRSITQSYYRSAHCLILVYDISSQPSFDALAKWVRDVETVLDSGSCSNKSSSVLKVLVGNKCDKEREIPSGIASKFASANNFDMFVETSALDNESVDKLFVDIANCLAKRRKLDDLASNNDKQSTKGMSNDDNDNKQERISGSDLSSVKAAIASRAKFCLQC